MSQYVTQDPRTYGLDGSVGAITCYVAAGIGRALYKYGAGSTAWCTIPPSGAAEPVTVDPRSSGLARVLGSRVMYVSGGTGTVLIKYGSGATEWCTEGTAIPASGGSATQFLRADGVWAAATGGSDDPTLDALAALDGSTGLLEQTGVDTFAKRALGVGAVGSIPTRADADARYAVTAHNHDGTYATAAHNHDGTYATAGHTHGNVSSGSAGFAPASGGGTANFLRADATWAAPGGGSPPTGVFSDLQASVLQGAHTLAAASGVQAWGPAAQDAFTVAANTTYRVTGRYIIATGTTTHTTAMAWALATATVASFEYLANLWSAAANTISTAQSSCHVTGVASKVLNATSAAVRTIIEFDGILVTTLGGTITPQINFSANPTGTIGGWA